MAGYGSYQDGGGYESAYSKNVGGATSAQRRSAFEPSYSGYGSYVDGSADSFASRERAGRDVASSRISERGIDPMGYLKDTMSVIKTMHDNARAWGTHQSEIRSRDAASAQIEANAKKLELENKKEENRLQTIDDMKNAGTYYMLEQFALTDGTMNSRTAKLAAKTWLKQRNIEGEFKRIDYSDPSEETGGVAVFDVVYKDKDGNEDRIRIKNDNALYALYESGFTGFGSAIPLPYIERKEKEADIKYKDALSKQHSEEIKRLEHGVNVVKGYDERLAKLDKEREKDPMAAETEEWIERYNKLSEERDKWSNIVWEMQKKLFGATAGGDTSSSPNINSGSAAQGSTSFSASGQGK